MVARRVSCRSQDHILANSKVCEMDQLCQDKKFLGNWRLNLSELLAEILQKHFL